MSLADVGVLSEEMLATFCTRALETDGSSVGGTLRCSFNEESSYKKGQRVVQVLCSPGDTWGWNTLPCGRQSLGQDHRCMAVTGLCMHISNSLTKLLFV